MKATNLSGVLRYFKGKPLEKITALWPRFEASVAAGEWEPGLSRAFAAAMDKTTMLRDYASEHERDLLNIQLKSEYGSTYSGARSVLDYVRRARWGWEHTATKLGELEALEGLTAGQQAGLAELRKVVDVFYPVYLAAKRLDAVRPKPVFTQLGVSPTITATLQATNLNLDLMTIRQPPRKWAEVQQYNPKLKKWETIQAIIIDWPEGTLHGRSRFYGGPQCQACGHRISNPWNWVAVLIDNKAGVPHSLWVGRDCAESVFGIKVKGELHYAGLGVGLPPRAPESARLIPS